VLGSPCGIAGAPADKIAAAIHAYRTFAELARKAGERFNKSRLTPPAGRIVTWLNERARKRQVNDLSALLPALSSRGAKPSTPEPGET